MVYVRGDEMLSKIPIDVAKLRKEELDKEILRTAIIAELDAINLYEQIAAKTKNKRLRALLLDVAREEKTHVGEFQTFLLMQDKEQEEELGEGKKEVEALMRESKK
jgi:rubrerythrin